MDVCRDATPIVSDANSPIAEVEEDSDVGAVARLDFVDRVVQNFEHEMVEAPLARAAYVHARALAHRFKALQHLEDTVWGSARGLERMVARSFQPNRSICDKGTVEKHFVVTE